MPYIKQDQRTSLVNAYRYPTTSGELNFKITEIVHQYLEDKGLNYTNINEVMGVLECAKLELYRVIASPYEDKKAFENGYISNLDRPKLNNVQ